MRAHPAAMALTLVSIGCQSETPIEPPQASSGPSLATAAASAPAASAAPAVPTGPFRPSSAVPPIEIKGEPGSCPELAPPAPGAERVSQIAAALRRVACEPALFAKPAADVQKELALPQGVTVSFSDAGGIRFDVDPMPPMRDLIAALGIDEPVARLQWQAYHASWWLGSNAQSGQLDRFGPGKIQIQLTHDADQEDPQGKVIPWEASMTARDAAWISMPGDVVTMKPDGEGVQQLATAMKLLAADPALLAREPDEVAKKLELVGERFRVARTSLHRGDVEIEGISIQPQRTLIMADALAGALGLEGEAENVNQEHDVWEMSVLGSTIISFRGIEIEVRVDPKKKGDRTTTLDGAEVTFVSMRPGGASAK